MVKLQPGPHQTWTDYVRQLLSFCFGVVIIVYGIFVSDNSLVPELVIGLLLMGIVPLDVVLTRLGLGAPAPPTEPATPAVVVETVPAEKEVYP